MNFLTLSFQEGFANNIFLQESHETGSSSRFRFACPVYYTLRVPGGKRRLSIHGIVAQVFPLVEENIHRTTQSS